jgi:hypothetical protein
MAAKKWTEGEVDRDPKTGAPRTRAHVVSKIEKIKREARRQEDLNDRIGPRLRWGWKGTEGWWFLPKGRHYWIKRQDKPGWHQGYYFHPKHWAPVVPPRAEWNNPESKMRHEFHGPAGTPGAADELIPWDVKDAAGIMVGLRYHDDESAREEQYNSRTRRKDYETVRGRAKTTVVKKRRG